MRNNTVGMTEITPVETEVTKSKNQESCDKSKKFNKTEFIARVAEHQDISKVEARQIVDNVINEIADVIKERNFVYFTELGTFGVKFKEAHESRNPATGETVNVEAKYVPDFKFGSQIKNALKGVGVDAD